MFKSIAVVLGSYALSVALVFATDPLLSRIFPGDFVAGRVPSNISLLSSTGFFILVSVFCAWLCAHFAPGRPSRHVFWFFAVGEVMGLAAAVPNWNNGWPHWYPLSWLLTWPISCYFGLLLAGRRTSQSSPSAA